MEKITLSKTKYAETTSYRFNVPEELRATGQEELADQVLIRVAPYSVNYYAARIIAPIFAETLYADHLITAEGLLFARGRSGILELAIEKALYEESLNFSEDPEGYTKQHQADTLIELDPAWFLTASIKVTQSADPSKQLFEVEVQEDRS